MPMTYLEALSELQQRSIDMLKVAQVMHLSMLRVARELVTPLSLSASSASPTTPAPPAITIDASASSVKPTLASVADPKPALEAFAEISAAVVERSAPVVEASASVAEASAAIVERSAAVVEGMEPAQQAGLAVKAIVPASEGSVSVAHTTAVQTPAFMDVIADVIAEPSATSILASPLRSLAHSEDGNQTAALIPSPMETSSDVRPESIAVVPNVQAPRVANEKTIPTVSSDEAAPKRGSAAKQKSARPR